MADVVTPVPAATILVVRDASGGIEVLMTRRHDAAGFAAGALVFPGGKVDGADAGWIAASRNGATLADPPASFWIAGVRETFEECGLLLARRRGADHFVTMAELKALVAEHGLGSAGFAGLLSAGTHELATDLLVPFAHWITPVDRPKRFDTRFFLAPAPEDQEPVVDGREATELLWISPQEALEGGESGRFSVVFATRLNLMRLARSSSVAEAIAAARRDTIVTVTPELVKTPAGMVIRIPEAAGYGITEMSAANLPRA